ncbi:MAG: ATP-binding protein [Phycisphaerae bacterium]|nr:ATP-binding protein [Phycisphaerae bacterium]
MGTARRLILVLIVLIALASSTAYYATQMSLRDGAVRERVMGWLAVGLMSSVCALVLIVIWRSLGKTVQIVRHQLLTLEGSGEVGLIMVDSHDELGQMVQEFNRYLTRIKSRIEQLKLQKRELDIQIRVADAEKRHTEAIIFSISDAVLVTDSFDELVLANESAERTFGFTMSRMYRQPMARIINDSEFVKLVTDTRSENTERRRRVVEYSRQVAGEKRTFNVTLSGVMDAKGECNGVVAVLHDVTREKEVAAMKTDFVSNVSHELRTPLSSIKAYVEMLVDGEAEDETTRREFYDIIQNETDRLGRLIDNILNISRIESGVVKIHKEPLALTSVIKDALEVARPQAVAKRIQLVDELTPVFYQVLADRDMIYQAILNLLSNAIKYTPDGGRVTIRTVVDEGKKTVRTEIKDTGVGIPPEDMPRLFEKFYRVESSKKMAKGTGLGLSLVKHIVETVHAGEVGVFSKVGQGSTFYFQVKLAD